MNKILVILILVILSSASAADIDRQSVDKNVIEKISQKENILKEKLDVIKIEKARFELIGKEINEAKIQDTSGNIFGIAIDENNNEIDINKLEDQEREAYKKKYGKSTKELYNKLQKMQDSDKIRVGIWFPEEIVGTPLIKEINNKGKIIYTSNYAPLIYAELSKNAIKEIQNRSDVEVIDEEKIAKPEINSAIPTIRANLVWPNVTGSGVKVAIIEDDGIAFANPYIKDGIYFKPSTPNIDFHATMIAGIIASTHSTYKGVAPGVYLLSGNSLDYYESSLIASSDWALRNGANILSLSWGIDYGDGYLHVMDKYYDYIAARYPYPTITKSAGNTGGRITSPGNAWNVITVGASDDKNTASWSGDSMTYFSAYIDPISPHSDREKPEVVTVGNRIKSTDMFSPWITPYEAAGTSFSGPAVAGEAALLMSKNTSLKRLPESIRAIIFASAVHNIEGNSRLSEKDGMGEIVANDAYKIVARNQFKHKTIAPGESYPIKYRFYASSGKKIRVAIAWNSKSTGPYGVDSLKVDLDLRIKSPSGTIISSSASFDNNYEIVEFIAPSSGYYEAQISKRRWDSGYPNERLGFAYYIS